MRRKNAGLKSSQTVPAFQLFFSELVADDIFNPQKSNIECSSFKAAQQTSRIHALDESGVFGGVCARHDIPHHFLDMRNGEKFIYGNQILKNIVDEYPTKKVR
jgi:hypothetical protein